MPSPDDENATSSKVSLKRNIDDCLDAHHEMSNSYDDVDEDTDFFDFDREFIQPKPKRRASMPSMHVRYAEQFFGDLPVEPEAHRPLKRRNSMNDSERHRNVDVFALDMSSSSRISSIANFHPVDFSNDINNDIDGASCSTSDIEDLEDSLMELEEPSKLMQSEAISSDIGEQSDVVKPSKEIPSQNVTDENDTEKEDGHNGNEEKPSKKISPEELNRELEERLEKLQSLMMRSSVTQRALQRWDKKAGLPKNHSVTMVKSEDSRQKIQEDVVLAKVIAEASRLTGTVSTTISQRVSSFL